MSLEELNTSYRRSFDKYKQQNTQLFQKEWIRKIFTEYVITDDLIKSLEKEFKLLEIEENKQTLLNVRMGIPNPQYTSLYYVRSMQIISLIKNEFISMSI